MKLWVSKMDKMSENDEIDLFEFLEICKKGKWLIIMLTLISLSLGFFYISQKTKNLPEPYYLVAAPYSVNLYSFISQQFCMEDLQCIKERTSEELKSIAGKDWTGKDWTGEDWTGEGLQEDGPIKKEWMEVGINLTKVEPDCSKDRTSFCIFLRTRSPQKLESYYRQISSFNNLLTEKVLREAKVELLALKGNNLNFLADNDALVEKALEKQRLISVIENGAMVINFDEVIVEKVDAPLPVVSIILSLFLLLGVASGCVYLLIQRVINDRRQTNG